MIKNCGEGQKFKKILIPMRIFATDYEEIVVGGLLYCL